MSTLADVVEEVCVEVIRRADELNRLDAAAGDGDLGVTAANMARVLLEHRDTFTRNDPGRAFSEAGFLVAEAAPSTSGTLLASGLLGVGRAAKAPRSNPSLYSSELLSAAYAAITKRGEAERGARTMLDALGPACDAAGSAAARGESLAGVLEAAAQAASDGAEETAAMTAKFGRAAWMPDRAVTQIDAGAQLIAIILCAAARALGTTTGKT